MSGLTLLLASAPSTSHLHRRSLPGKEALFHLWRPLVILRVFGFGLVDDRVVGSEDREGDESYETSGCHQAQLDQHRYGSGPRQVSWLLPGHEES